MILKKLLIIVIVLILILLGGVYYLKPKRQNIIPPDVVYIPKPVPIINGDEPPIIPNKPSINNFRFGVGFMRPGASALMQKMGAEWAKQDSVRWDIIEPKPPIAGKHTYNWNIADRVVKEWTGTNFNIYLVLKSYSPWATRAEYAGHKGGCFAGSIPNDINDYKDWVKAVAERYDKDGVDDMPGLVKAINYFEIESEAQHEACWKGGSSDYLKLLEAANIAIKSANPNAKIVLSGINFGDLFDDLPNLGTITERAQFIKKSGRNDLDFIKETLSSSFYDEVEFHYNRDYLGIIGAVDFIRNYTKKPITAGDMTSVPWLDYSGSDFVSRYGEKGKELLSILGNKNNPNNVTVTEWIRKEQTKLTIKKVSMSMGNGLAGINVENIYDFGDDWSAIGLGTWMASGILNKDNSPRSVYYAYQKFIQKFGDLKDIKRIVPEKDPLDLKGKGIWAFQGSINTKKVIIAWLEDGVAECPICVQKKEIERVLDLSSYFSSPNVQVTNSFTPNKSVIVSTKAVTLSETPVYIEQI